MRFGKGYNALGPNERHLRMVLYLVGRACQVGCRSVVSQCLAQRSVHVAKGRIRAAVERPIKRMGEGMTKLEGRERVEELPEIEIVLPKDVEKRSFLKKAEVKAFVTVQEDQEPGSFENLGLEDQLLVSVLFDIEV